MPAYLLERICQKNPWTDDPTAIEPVERVAS